MMYVALCDNLSRYCWPFQAKKEYIEAHGEKALESLSNSEIALWLGTWLAKHKKEFKHWDSSVETDDIVESEAVYWDNCQTFAWSEPKDGKHPDDRGICCITVFRLPDNALWTIEIDDDIETERLVVFEKPDKNGYLERIEGSF